MQKYEDKDGDEDEDEDASKYEDEDAAIGLVNLVPGSVWRV